MEGASSWLMRRWGGIWEEEIVAKTLDDRHKMNASMDSRCREWIKKGKWDGLLCRLGVFFEPFVVEGLFGFETLVRVVREELVDEIVG